MSVRPSAQWQRQHDRKVMEQVCAANLAKFAAQDQKRADEKAKVEAIAKANLTKWAAEKAAKEAFARLCQENREKAARAAEALKLARSRISASEWEEFSGRIGDIARNGKGDYTPEQLLSDLRKWGCLEAGRFIQHCIDPEYVAPAIKLG